ncbi:hypothetical protein [Nevskia sp.]|uniref:hypothetical protein n=1 Tax=Nevskia sp. TaxID=1929292 RepID=UPI0025EF5C89|nr:hypothetical protein [Nevskia sp.]
MSIDKFKATAESITLHGLGFLQVQLHANQRLHVWHPELPRRRCFAHSNVHDHRFSFRSLVLVGTQINTVYTCHKQSDAMTHCLYLHEGERTAFGNRPWIIDGEAFVYPGVPQIVRSGETYSMGAYVFHSTTPAGDGCVATLMTKTFEGEIGAHSTCTIGIEPDIDFDRKQWGEAELWQVVRDVLGGSRG